VANEQSVVHLFANWSQGPHSVSQRYYTCLLLTRLFVLWAGFGSEAITNGKYSERPTFNPVKFLIVP